MTMLSFLLGAATSLLCGYLSMKIAVFSNVKTCHQTWLDLGLGFNTALKAGGVMGFAVVSFTLLSLLSLILFFRLESLFGTDPQSQPRLFETLAGIPLKLPPLYFLCCTPPWLSAGFIESFFPVFPCFCLYSLFPLTQRTFPADHYVFSLHTTPHCLLTFTFCPLQLPFTV